VVPRVWTPERKDARVPSPQRRLLGPRRLAKLAQPRVEGRASATSKRPATQSPAPGAAPAGTRPRDLRSSYITLRVYEGVPLTTISKEVGTSVQMIEQHYAGVIENWDGQRIPAEDQIRTPREQRTLRGTG
jgi:hypothetical protein